MYTLCLAVGLAAGQPAPAYRLDDFVRMSRAELEAIYRAAEPGETPHGVTRGRAIPNPGGRFNVASSRLVRVLWQGKFFTDDGIMRNRVLGLRTVPARVYTGASWLDGRPAVVLDYAGTSRLFPDVRDEIREVGPGVWLGAMFVRRPAGPELSMFFALAAGR